MGNDPAPPGIPVPVHLALSGQEWSNRQNSGGQRHKMDTTGRRKRTRSRWWRTPASPGLVTLVALLALVAATAAARSVDTSSASLLPTTAPTQDDRMTPIPIEPAPVVGTEVPGSEPGGDLAFLGAVRQVQANGITIGYRQIGSGPPVVLVVGQGCTMAMWGTDLPRRLAAHHQ